MSHRHSPCTVGLVASRATGKIVFLFPGQGSQRTGMLRTLRAWSAFERELLKLDDAAARTDRSLLALVDREATEAHDRELTATENAQPALGIVSLALARAAMQLGIVPDFFAGHSYGELTALAAAGALDQDTFVRLSFERGRRMAAAGALAAGAMLAVRADVATVTPHLCAGVVVANLNGPKQTVLSGDLPAIEATAARLSAANIGTVRLRTACAFHSPLMQPVAADWAGVLEGVAVEASRAAKVLSNVTASPYAASAAAVREGLALQLTSAVRWRETIERLYECGVRTFVEVGPGRVLTDLASQILAGRDHQAIALESEGAGVESALRALVAPDATSASSASHSLALSVADASERALASVLAHQKEIAKLAEGTSASDRNAVATALVASSERLLQDFLATQRAALAAAFGTTNVAHVARAATKRLETDVPVLEEAPTDDRAGLERFLRRALTDLTGFPAAMIGRDTDFERDLALDSITMVELFCQIIDVYPALKGMGTRLRTLKTLGAAVDALHAELARAAAPVAVPVPAPSQVRVAGDATARAIVLECLRASTSKPCVDIADIADDAGLEADLGLDVFGRESLAALLIERVPGLAVGGRELLRERSVGELIAVCERLSTPAVAKVRPVAPATAATSPAVQRWVRRLAPSAVQAASVEGKVLLVGPPGQRLRALAAVAKVRGLDVATLIVTENGFLLEGHGRSSLGDVEGLRALLADVVNVAERPAALFLAMPSTRRAFVGASFDGRALELGATALFTFAKAVMTEGESPLPGVSRLGVLAANDPLWRGAHGVARALGREWDVPVRTASLAGEAPPVRVFDALLGGDTAHDIVLDGMRVSRFELTPTRTQTPTQAGGASDGTRLRVGSHEAVLLVGGGRGITAELAVSLASRYRCRIAVVGRTPMPSARPDVVADDASKKALELWETKARVEQAGGSFFYRVADATRAGELAEALCELRAEAGAFVGVVHGVGVAEDARIEKKSLSSFRRVLESKALSASHLQRILESEPLRFAFMLSSLSSHAGTAGQTDYVAANEIVNALAARWNEDVDYPVRAMLYSVWSEAGLAGAALKRQMSRLGLEGIGNAAGTSAFLAELDRSEDDAWVLFSPESTLRYAEGVTASRREPHRATG